MMISQKFLSGVKEPGGRPACAVIRPAIFIAAVFLASCGYFSIGPRDNIRVASAAPGAGGEQPDHNSSVIMGRVDGGGGAVMVAAYPTEGHGRALEHYVVLSGPGPFMLYLPAGRYHLYAFTDRDFDGYFRAGELSGACKDDAHPGLAVIEIGEGEVRHGVLISAGTPKGAREELPRIFRVQGDPRALPRQPGNGEVAALYEERFCPENATTGWWTPTLFMQGFGARIYFVRPFEPGKIPVLFVHGAQGSPRDWAYFLIRLDRKRYQPWFFYYPTGIRLSLASRLLYEALRECAGNHRFRTIILTAHSMGGLVTHDLLARYDLRAIGIDPVLHITLASPWSGFDSAERALRLSNKKLPVWYDMATGSPFINRILSTRIPSSVGHYMFYGTGDDVARGRALDERAYRAADGMFGFDVDHGTILSDRKCFRTYAKILDGAAR